MKVCLGIQVMEALRSKLRVLGLVNQAIHHTISSVSKYRDSEEAVLYPACTKET